VDVSIPTAPTEVGSCDTSGSARSVAIEGTLAYVAAGDLSIVDVSVPSSPVLVGIFDTSWTPRDVAVAGSYAYLTDLVDGLRIVDVSNPTSPFEVGVSDTVAYTNGVAGANGRAYLAEGYAGLRVVDVSTPSAPLVVGFSDEALQVGDATGIAVQGDLAFLAASDAGVEIFDTTPCQTIPEADQWVHIRSWECSGSRDKTVGYQITVGNDGPWGPDWWGTNFVQVTDVFPSQLTDVTWTCDSSGDYLCNPTGSGDIGGPFGSWAARWCSR
jgi:uncharacterized repeat protein (TIGR01451 family)